MGRKQMHVVSLICNLVFWKLAAQVPLDLRWIVMFTGCFSWCTKMDMLNSTSATRNKQYKYNTCVKDV